MSLKATLMSGKNFHLYKDYGDGRMGYLPHLTIKGKEIELPDDLGKALLNLILLHDSCKAMYEYTTELDKIDGGLFAINLKSGKKSEYKHGKLRKVKK